jgi:phosphatidylserine decarboxylase
MVGIHKEGILTILGALCVLIAINALAWWLTPSVVGWILLLSAIVLVLIVQFFRNPRRKIEIFDNNIVYAPADGKVVVIEETAESEYFKESRLQVSIFMNPLNVHVNRNPVGGLIKYVRYHEGKHLVAWNPKSSSENERTTIVINNGKTDILLRQIAGALAKRIKYYVREGEVVKQGSDMGFIKFGSRVDIFLPLTAQLKVKLEDKVMGNKTVIATLP